VDLIEDLSVFFRSLGGLMDGFRDRARRVSALLGDPATTFVLVTSPEREPIDEAIFFWRKLRAARMPFGGVVVNKVHQDVPGEARLTDELGDALAGRVARTARDYGVLADRDRANIERLAGELGSERLLMVPHLDEDVHDAAGLVRLERLLFAGEAERPERAAA
jgi:anion-transporting  ArsA/GET3 family ATPase